MLGRGARGDLDSGVAHVDMDRGTGEQGNRGTGKQENKGGEEDTGKKVSTMRELDGELDGSVHSYRRTSFIDASWDTCHLFSQLFSIHATVQAAAHCTQHYSPRHSRNQGRSVTPVLDRLSAAARPGYGELERRHMPPRARAVS